MKKIKIAICLPSLNEAETISYVTHVVDQGLKILQKKYNLSALIVNVDSNSNDQTQLIFQETLTTFPKLSHVIYGEKGKGRNLLWFFNYATRNSFDFGLTFDTDLISITPDWIVSFAEPLLNGGVDYVTPDYRRSKFEGSSTNNFAFPLIYAFTGKFIRQPISGDFGFNRFLMQKFCENSNSVQVERYGIDIYMSFIAAQFAGSIKQVSLDKKVHAPSFHKLEYMFPQIANALLDVISDRSIEGGTCEDFHFKSNFLENVFFEHKDSARDILERAVLRIKMEDFFWLSADFKEEAVNIAENIDSIESQKIITFWANILRQWLSVRFDQHDYSIDPGLQLLPFFVVRAITFWFWSEKHTSDQVELLVLNQAREIRRVLLLGYRSTSIY